MMAFLKKRRTSFGLLVWFLVVFLFAYISPGRTVERNSTVSLPRELTASRKHPAPPALSSPSLDADHDGIPDAEELASYGDRDNFRRWFTRIAETQFYQLSPQWNSDQRDCAGLVRFAYREALKRHDRAWFQQMGPYYEAVAPDVNRGDSPLGDKHFRVAFGAYEPGDVAAGRFSEFADARALKNFNTVFISRDRRAAQPGDLLFFYQPWVQKYPYHVMIFLGPAGIAANRANDWVVYHTGSSATDQGTVKKVQLSVLDHHPDPRWRPIATNPNFLGFYRLKILD